MEKRREPRWQPVIRGQVDRLEVDGGWLYRVAGEDDYRVAFAPVRASITVMFRQCDNDDDADDSYYYVVEVVDWAGDEMPGEWIDGDTLWTYVLDESCTIKVIGDPRDFSRVRPRDEKPVGRMAMADANSEQVRKAQEEAHAQATNGKDAEGQEGGGDAALGDADTDRGDEQSVR